MLRPCVLLTWAVFCTSPALTWPSGAPRSTCDTMGPSHGASARSSPSPFSLTVTPGDPAPGQTVTVTISGGNGRTFKGFMLEAFKPRTPGATKELRGTFSKPSGTQYIQCSTGNALTQSSKSRKSSLTFTWAPPADVTSGERIIFSATIIQSEKTFWLDVNQDITITVPAPATTLPPAPPATETTPGTDDAPATDPTPGVDVTEEPRATVTVAAAGPDVTEDPEDDVSVEGDVSVDGSVSDESVSSESDSDSASHENTPDALPDRLLSERWLQQAGDQTPEASESSESSESDSDES